VVGAFSAPTQFMTVGIFHSSILGKRRTASLLLVR
jgi:hypothetical protein